MDFKRISGFNAGEVPPDAPEGEWTATFKVFKKSATQEKDDGTGGYPMLTIEVILDSASDAANESYEGTHLFDRIVLYPPSVTGKTLKASKFALRKLNALGTLLGFNPSEVIPRDITEWSDLDGLVASIDNQRSTVWTKHRKDRRNDGAIEVEILYQPPRESFNNSNQE